MGGNSIKFRINNQQQSFLKTHPDDHTKQSTTDMLSSNQPLPTNAASLADQSPFQINKYTNPDQDSPCGADLIINSIRLVFCTSLHGNYGNMYHFGAENLWCHRRSLCASDASWPKTLCEMLHWWQPFGITSWTKLKAKLLRTLDSLWNWSRRESRTFLKVVEGFKVNKLLLVVV